MSITTVRGINTIMKRLNVKLKEIEFKTARGYVEVASMIRRDMEQNPPLIPVDTGNLRASWFSVVKGYQPKSRGQFKGRTPSERRRASQLAAEHKTLMGDFKAVVDAEKDPSLIMGFTANYATAVHEKHDPNIKWQRPNSGPNFFKASLNRNRKEIIATIKKNVVK